MNLILDLYQFRLHNLHFLDVKKNIIMDGNFTKLIYSDHNVTLNGIYLRVPIQYYGIEQIMNKNAAKFHSYQGDNLLYLKQLCALEEELIECYRLHFQCRKDPNLLLRDQLAMGFLKLYREYNSEPVSTPNSSSPKIMIKISGIWENKYQIGLTYKFLEMEEVS